MCSVRKIKQKSKTPFIFHQLLFYMSWLLVLVLLLCRLFFPIDPGYKLRTAERGKTPRVPGPDFINSRDWRSALEKVWPSVEAKKSPSDKSWSNLSSLKPKKSVGITTSCLQSSPFLMLPAAKSYTSSYFLSPSPLSRSLLLSVSLPTQSPVISPSFRPFPAFFLSLSLRLSPLEWWLEPFTFTESLCLCYFPCLGSVLYNFSPYEAIELVSATGKVAKAKSCLSILILVSMRRFFFFLTDSQVNYDISSLILAEFCSDI